MLWFDEKCISSGQCFSISLEDFVDHTFWNLGGVSLQRKCKCCKVWSTMYYYYYILCVQHSKFFFLSCCRIQIRRGKRYFVKSPILLVFLGRNKKIPDIIGSTQMVIVYLYWFDIITFRVNNEEPIFPISPNLKWLLWSKSKKITILKAKKIKI